ncbi:MAG: uracil-DNA glycosylase [Pseudomonadota bacterium]
MENLINCRNCRHYFITWEPVHPHGCRAINFKSRLMPSIQVFRLSGQPCLLFEEKVQGKKPARP